MSEFLSPKAARPFRAHAFETEIRPIKTRAWPIVFVSNRAYGQMWLLVNQTVGEVSWLGTVQRLPMTGDFFIEEVFLLSQSSGVEHTELDETGVAALLRQFSARGPEGEKQTENLRLWGHSHGNFEPTASDRDERTMSTELFTGMPWALRLIANRNGDIRITAFLYEQGIRIDDIQWQLVPEIDPRLAAQIALEFKQKVRPGWQQLAERAVDAVRKLRPSPTSSSQSDGGVKV